MSYWQYVPGPDLNTALYDQIIRSVSDDDIVVETSCGFGRGIHYLMEGFKAHNVRPKLYAFDTFGEEFASEYWEGHPESTPWNEPFASWAARVGGPGRLLDHFAFYLRNSPARDYLTDYAQFPHWTVAEEFADGSVKWVVMNGVFPDKTLVHNANKWRPKLTIGGALSLTYNKPDGTAQTVYRES